MFWRKPWVSALLFLQLLLSVNSFNNDLLKTCVTSGFCRRNRVYSRQISRSGNVYYSMDRGSLRFGTEHTVSGNILKRIPITVGDDKVVVLPFTLDLLSNNTVRFTIDEERSSAVASNGLKKQRYRAAEWSVVDGPMLVPHHEAVSRRKSALWKRDFVYVEDKKGLFKIQIQLSKFSIKIYRANVLQLTVNDRNFINLEHWRDRQSNVAEMLPEEIEYGMFQDSFRHSWADSLPLGPESVALDFTLHDSNNVYGIPEHADSLRLRDTTMGEPYRLFNADVFEFSLNSSKPMYGSIPFMISSSPKSSVGIFWVNSADTWIDISYTQKSVQTHWMSENNVIDVFLFFAEDPKTITKLYTEVTGKPGLPPLSSLGFHQCRWNYPDDKYVLTVNSEFDAAQIPYDTIWLDLEYTDNRKFFTWKSEAFPDPLSVLAKLSELGRNMAVLIDPHLKYRYNISDTVVRHSAAVLNRLGQTFLGECWPGTSIWIDTFAPAAREVWTSFFQRFVAPAKNLFIWNDMDEPSVFNGPETTAPKDLIHYPGFEHRSVHNLYGKTFHDVTYDALLERYAVDNLRPFILTRSFFAGSQRTTAMWFGDTAANWDYLKYSIPMVLSSNIAGMPLCGSDVGGFTGNPDVELQVRWYQAGVWYPFFRAHAHIESKGREPYLLPEPEKSIVRDAIRLRYSLLPTFYTAFHEANTTGMPVISPMFFQNPNDNEVYDIDDQFYLGQHGILVKPVTTQNTNSTDIYLPAGIFYDYYSFERIVSSGDRRTVRAPLDTIPIFLQGGHIISRRDRPRRASKLMSNDPYTLVVLLDENGIAEGSLYIDDGETFAYQRGEYTKLKISLCKGVLSGRLVNHHEKFAHLAIERIIITKGQASATPEFVTVVQDGKNTTARVKQDANTYTIQKPSITLASDWSIDL